MANRKKHRLEQDSNESKLTDIDPHMLKDLYQELEAEIEAE